MRLFFWVFVAGLFCPIILSCSNNLSSSPQDITIDRDGVSLNGKFYIPKGGGLSPAVILLKGFYDPGDDVLGIAKLLSEAGIGALVFQYSGTEGSQGEFSFKDTQKDIRAAFEFLRRRDNIRKFKIDTTHIHLVGLSYGGGMALTYAADNPGMKSVISIAGTDHGEYMRQYANDPEMQRVFDKWIESLTAPEGPVRIAEGFSIKNVIETGVESYLPTLDLRKSAPLLTRTPVLLIGGWDDTRISLENHLLPLYRALKDENAENVKITAVQDNHSFSSSSERLAQIIAEWIKTVDKP